MGGNGYEADQPLLERMISAVARFNELARGLGDSLDSLSQQQADGFEAVRREVRDEIRALERVILGIGHDVEEVRKDQTDPRMRIPPEFQGQPPYRNGKGDSGKLVALARVAEKVPTPWVAGLLKLSLSAGLGGLALQFIQWLANGH